MTLRSAVKMTILVLVTVGGVGGGNSPAEAQGYGSLRWTVGAQWNMPGVGAQLNMPGVGAQLIIPETDVPPMPQYHVYANPEMMGTVNYYGSPAQPVAPPQPNLASSLPPGARAGVINGELYCYYKSAWYKPTLFGGTIYYARVSPPYGAVVASLPEGTTPVTVSGVTYYSTMDGIYYQPVYSEGWLHYRIVATPPGR